MTQARSARSAASGKVRVARLTDLAALGELSRLCQDESAATRSLGLPVSGRPMSAFSLFRLPLGAFQPRDPFPGFAGAYAVPIQLGGKSGPDRFTLSQHRRRFVADSPVEHRRHIAHIRQRIETRNLSYDRAHIRDELQ